MLPRLFRAVTAFISLFIINFTTVHVITKMYNEQLSPASADVSNDFEKARGNVQASIDIEQKLLPPVEDEGELPLTRNAPKGSEEAVLKDIEDMGEKIHQGSKLEQLESLNPSGPEDVGQKPSARADLEVSSVCLNVTKPQASEIKMVNSWQEFKIKLNSIFLHRAHFDDRMYLKNTPFIRIYMVVPFQKLKPPIYCYLWYDTSPYLITLKASHIYNLSSGKKTFWINQKTYTQQLISCKVLDSRVPRHISLALTSCQHTDNLLGVSKAYHYPQPVHEFAVCTVPQYGRMEDDEVAFFVEWIELHKMFGVKEITIYNSTLKLSRLSEKAYEHYTREGTLIVEQHQTPVDKYPPNKEYFVSQLGLRSSLNDCILRNMYRYKYIIIVDRDEIIVPRSHTDYSSLLQSEINYAPDIEKSPAITVFNAFFYRDYEEDTTLQTSLISMKYRTHKIPDSPFASVNFIPAKSFVNPQRCMSVWNHHCLLPWYGKKFLKPEVVLVHHYRSSCSAAGSLQDSKLLSKTRCSHLFNQTVTDNNMLRFKDILESAVSEKLKAISQM